MPRITVRVIPRAHEARVEENDDGTYTVRVIVPRESGRANEAVRRLLAEYFDVALSQVRIISGPRARRKIIQVDSAG